MQIKKWIDHSTHMDLDPNNGWAAHSKLLRITLVSAVRTYFHARLPVSADTAVSLPAPLQRTSNCCRENHATSTTTVTDPTSTRATIVSAEELYTADRSEFDADWRSYRPAIAVKRIRNISPVD